jgi:hypothetical protein
MQCGQNVRFLNVKLGALRNQLALKVNTEHKLIKLLRSWSNTAEHFSKQRYNATKHNMFRSVCYVLYLTTIYQMYNARKYGRTFVKVLEYTKRGASNAF